jgi:hypothetical protein
MIALTTYRENPPAAIVTGLGKEPTRLRTASALLLETLYSTPAPNSSVVRTPSKAGTRRR